MEQVIIQMLNGNLNVEMILMLFIIGILTKRFVPWWIHEEALEELKKYEEDAPQLMNAVQDLTEEIRSKGMKSDKLDVVEQRQQDIRLRYPSTASASSTEGAASRRYRDGPNIRARRTRHD